MIDPIKEKFPACTMPLSSTSPVHVTPEIMRNRQYAEEYIAHVALIRELLDQSSLSTNATLLTLSNNSLFRSLGGLLKGVSDCELSGKPIPTWNLVRVLRSKSDAALVRKTTVLMDGAEGFSINMPSAPMPMPEGDAPAFMHPRLVTSLTGNQPYYIRGGLIPHLTKKGYFWKSMAPAIHLAVLKYRLYIDPENSAHLAEMKQIDCGWVPPLSRIHQYDAATGLHKSLGPDCALKNVQYWIKVDGTTAKAASPVPPPMTWSNTVHGLTQHFEQMSMRNVVNPMDVGHFLDDATAEPSNIVLKHDEISTELYTGHVLPALELVSEADRHNGTRLQLKAIGVQLNWTLNQEVVFSTALTGKPCRKQSFSQYCWKRCVIGTKTDYSSAVNRAEWQQALQSAAVQNISALPVPRLSDHLDTEIAPSDEEGGKEAKRHKSEPTTPISTCSRPPHEYDEVMGITQVDSREAERFEHSN